MKHINLVLVSGRIFKGPTLREGSFGLFGSLTMAISDLKKVKDKWVEEKTWIEVVLKGKLAERCQKMALSKDNDIYVKGSLKLESWEDAEGKKQSRHKIIAEDIWDVSGRMEPNTEDF